MKEFEAIALHLHEADTNNDNDLLVRGNATGVYFVEDLLHSNEV